PGMTGATKGIITGSVDGDPVFDSACLLPGDITFEATVTDNNGCIVTDEMTLSLIHCFDLAIRKRVDGPQVVMNGDEVRFEIDVFNQGTVDAFEVLVVDRPIDAFDFSLDRNTIQVTGNPLDWELQNDEIITRIPALPAGTSTTLFINLRVKENNTLIELPNEAEIIGSSSVYKNNPLDEDDLEENEENAREVDDEISDDSHGGADDPLDEDKLDAAFVSTCLFYDTSLTYSRCHLLTDLSIELIELTNLIDPDGDGDGEETDGDSGNFVSSFHLTEFDANADINPIYEINEDHEIVYARLISNGFCISIIPIQIEQVGHQVMACEDLVNISLTGSCNTEILPFQILVNESELEGQFEVNVIDPSGFNLGSQVDGMTYLGDTLKVEVLNSCSGNTCWGQIVVEDKIAPVIQCPDTVRLSCFDVQWNPSSILSYDNCDDVQLNILDQGNRDQCFTLNDSLYIDEYYYVLQVEDSSGNKSSSCEVTVLSEAIDLKIFDFPDDISFDCNNQSWDINGNNYPDPIESGRFNLNGKHVDAYDLPQDCNIYIDFEDTRIETCGCSYKILRTWHLINWCAGEFLDVVQTIKIQDTIPPVLNHPNETLIIDIDNIYCTAEISAHQLLSYLEIQDASPISVTYAWAELKSCHDNLADQNFLLIDEADFRITDLEEGCYAFRISVSDECNNLSTAFIRVRLVDKLPPTAICEGYNVTSIQEGNHVRIDAEVLDDGSLDNCSTVHFGIRNPDMGCFENEDMRRELFSAGGKTYYEADYFCCKDSIAELLVYDRAFNYSTCIVRLAINPNNTVGLICGNDVTVDCLDYNTGDFRVPGALVDEGECELLTIMDSVQYEIPNLCGEVESIVTNYFLYSGIDGTLLDECSTKISIENLSSFELQDLKLPEDYLILNKCIDPLFTDPLSDIYAIQEQSGLCNELAISYEDNLTNLGWECGVLVRTWTIIDWCAYVQSNQTSGVITHVQQIYFENDIAPSIECEDITVSINDKEECIINLDYSIPYFQECLAVPDYFVSHYYEGKSYQSSSAQFQWNVGDHVIEWKVSDRCNNTSTCQQTVTVVDELAPIPYCYASIAVTLDAQDKRVEIWASDTHLNLVDDCGSPLRFTFTDNLPLLNSLNHYFKIQNGQTVPAAPSEYGDDGVYFWDSNLGSASTFLDCNDVEGEIMELWIWDDQNNSASCQSRIVISNANICQQGRMIEGEIKDMYGNLVNNFKLQIFNDVEMIDNISLSSGEFNLEMLVQEGVKITAYKNDELLKYVSTLDILHIQNHILGNTRFSDARQLLAADLDNDMKVSASDLIALRRLILGVDKELPYNTSFRFVDPDQKFDIKNFEHLNEFK
ncbi:MAG: hypothetical protein HKN09_05150, partial [Saprospiraceae bacterium]|nr:hypothetical protein [Saprospiraceae bacterium]